MEVADTEQLLGIAAAMEREAARRYDRFAESMAAMGEEALANLFRDLAAQERQHEDAIGRWAQREIGKQPPVVGPPENAGEILRTEEDETTATETLSPYRALNWAVRNEERAFAYYSYVAAYAGDASVRATAEGLAREELEHAALLRKARRRAFHAERTDDDFRRRLGLAGKPPRTLSALAVIAARLESHLAAEHRRLAEQYHAGKPRLAADLDRFADEERERAASLRGMIAEEDGALSEIEVPGRESGSGSDLLNSALKALEATYEFYFLAAENADDEKLMHLAQKLAEKTIGTIARLRVHEGDET